VSGWFTSIAAGSAHTCGISASEVMCWGANRFGQLGDGTTEDRTAPVSVEGLQGTPVRIAAGAVHTCALVSDGSTYCWGQNLHGQLGDGSTQNRSTPTAVGGSLRFERIHAGGALTCGFTAAGAQHCWGLNQSGQLGDGTRANRALPTRVGG
jgi:alpha-tubulin suppressor-like RCC1 family protein